MKTYLDLLDRALTEGVTREDRTGTGTRSVFGHQMRFDLREGFPLLTTKRMFTRGMIAELLWFISGDTNEHTLRDQNVHIWREWADPVTGDLGPIYGKQMRSWATPDGDSIDQLSRLVDSIRRDPFSRRHVMTLWNPADIDKMALPPCHGNIVQFYVTPDAAGRPATLSCQMYQRSGDIFLGVPFNIASYALLTAMMAQVTRLEAGEFVHTLGDAHLYLNHVEQAREQLSREPLPLPKLVLNPAVRELTDFTLEDVAVIGYTSHPAIKGDVAV